MLPTSAAGDESEALQADVMRFVAILGLCLMVIFALVQSLPAVSESREEAQARERERADLLAELARTQGELASLAAELDADESDLNALADALRAERGERAALEAEVLRSESTLVARLAELDLAVSETEAELARSEAARHAAEREQEASERALAALQDSVEREAAESDPLPGPVTTRVEEAPTSEQVEPPTPVTERESESTPTETNESAEPVTSDEEGFTMRFESDAALYALVARGDVDVIAKVDGKLWKLAPDGQRMLPGTASATVFDITESTVPSDLPRRLRQSGAGDAPARWGVSLSAGLARTIADRQAEASGGVLVIGEDGSVALR